MTALLIRRPGVLMAAAVAVGAIVILLENAGAGPLNRLLLYLPGVDKLLHVTQSFFIAWALLVIARHLPIGHRARVTLAIAAAVTLALFDEWQQQWFGARTIEAADIIAGMAGVSLAAAATERRHAPRIATAIGIAAAVLAIAVTADSYRRTKDFNRGLLAEGRGDFAAAYHHFVAAHAAGVRSAELFNALAWTGVESGAATPADAVQHAENSLRVRPGNADALDTYGWALHKAGRSADALAPLAEALRRDPDIYCIHYHLGATLAALGDLTAARRHLQLQRDLHPATRESRLAAELLNALGGSP